MQKGRKKQKATVGIPKECERGAQRRMCGSQPPQKERKGESDPRSAERNAENRARLADRNRSKTSVAEGESKPERRKGARAGSGKSDGQSREKCRREQSTDAGTTGEAD